jgi:dTDP-4-dehydrorhamnose reductase
MSSIYDRILITGGGGMLAKALNRSLRARGQEAILLDRAALDITTPEAVDDAFGTYRPTLVLNAAAYTKVDLAEIELEQAERANARGVQVLSLHAADYRAKFVHYSTDFVFDGRSRRPYRADDATNPASAYGRSKLNGEKQLRPADLLIRTAWLYGPGGACFPQTMINAARAGKPLKVVDDQVGSPTFTHDLAEATLNLIDAGATGVYHVVNSGQTSWFDFTAAILEEFNLKTELTRTTSADWKKLRPNSAARPAYSVLDTSKYTQTTGKSTRHWREALHAYRLAVESAQASS